MTCTIHRVDAIERMSDRCSSDYLLVSMLLWSRFTHPWHEGLHLLQSESAIFVGIHRLEDFFVSGLKFLQ